MESLQKIQSALSFINSDDRLIWIRVGTALKSELGESGFEIWNQWSKTSTKYDKKSAINNWKCLKSGMVSIASLYFEAKKFGFNPKSDEFKPASSSEIQANKIAVEKARQKSAAQKEKLFAQSAEIALKEWNCCDLLQPSHPYIVSKGLEKFDNLRILKQDKKNNIVVPVKRFGYIIGLQKIGPNGFKSFQKNIHLEGSSFIIGSWNDAKKNGVIIAEGLATALTVSEATKKTVIVAFIAGNIPNISTTLAKANIQVLIASDNDENETGLKYSKKAKEILGNNCEIVMPIFTEEQIAKFKNETGKIPSDFNDLYKISGLSAVKDLLADQLKLMSAKKAMQL